MSKPSSPFSRQLGTR